MELVADNAVKVERVTVESVLTDSVRPARVACDPMALFEAHIEWARGHAKAFRSRRRMPLHMAEALENSALIGLWSASQRYVPGAALFSTYAYWPVYRAMCDEIRTETDNFRTVNNVEFNCDMSNGVKDAMPLDAADDVAHLMSKCVPVEQRILRGMLDGKSLRAIGDELRVTESRVCQRLAEIRKKAKAENN